MVHISVHWYTCTNTTVLYYTKYVLNNLLPGISQLYAQPVTTASMSLDIDKTNYFHTSTSTDEDTSLEEL